MSALPQAVGDGPAGVTLPRSARAQITIRGLSKAFGGAALYRDFDLDIARRSVVSIFGPNGCGKSTPINMVAGLIALFPRKRAIDSIRYPQKLAGRSAADVERRVEQLVSIMRALAPEPEVLFLDEPFSALDYGMTLFIRERLQQVLQREVRKGEGAP